MDTRIIIDIDMNEFDFVKGAIRAKANSLLHYMDACLDEALKKEKYKNDPRMPSFPPKKEKVVAKKVAKKTTRKTK